jgi:hypothetical protein
VHQFSVKTLADGFYSFNRSAAMYCCAAALLQGARRRHATRRGNRSLKALLLADFARTDLKLPARGRHPRRPLVHNLTVVTRNVRDFTRFDVPALNPCK